MFWSILVYYPMAHMVWGQGGFLAEIGSVDFAGGNVVHISSGVSALIFAIILADEKVMRILLIVFITFHSLLLVHLSFGSDGSASMQEVPSEQMVLQLMHS